jgi:NIMA (never in mitosis gene a)-related kinase
MDDLLKDLSSKVRIDHVSKIGQGSFGEIYLIHEKTKELKVVKQVETKNLSSKDKSAAVEEALILARLSHPNILSLIDFFLGDQYL